MSNGDDLTALMKSIRRIVRALDVQSRRIDRTIGLTLPQLVVLRSVRDLGEVTSRAISMEADLSPPTVVGILDNLEAKGLIERYRSDRDRRIVHTRLTEKGASIVEEAPPLLGQAFAERFSGLDRRRRIELVAALEEIVALASAEADDVPSAAMESGLGVRSL
jgi:DNA-binding MarR family transcriptional regulator